MLVLSGSLTMTGTGAGKFTIISSFATLSGDIASGQTVTVEGTNSVNTNVYATGDFTNAGTLAMDSSGSGWALLQSTGGGPWTVTNTGTIKMLNSSGSPRYLRVAISNQQSGTVEIAAANVQQDLSTAFTNAGTVLLDAGSTLHLAGASSFAQSSTGYFQSTIDVPTVAFGAIVGNGSSSVTLDGKLAVITNGTPTTGQTWPVISNSVRSGTFSLYDMGGQPYNVTYPAAGVTLVTVPKLLVTTTSLPPVAVTYQYSQNLGVTGGITPYGNWSIASGALPNGLTLSPSGTISGTTQVPAGTYNFTVQISDSTFPPQVATKALSIQVNPACPAGTFPAGSYGRPTFGPGSPSGDYIWVDSNGIVHLLTTHPGTQKVSFVGTVTTTGIIRGLDPVSLESLPGNTDTATLNPAQNQLTFAFQNTGDIDGVNFALSCNATITFNLGRAGSQLPRSDIFIGPNKVHPPTDPFTFTIPVGATTAFRRS